MHTTRWHRTAHTIRRGVAAALAATLSATLAAACGVESAFGPDATVAGGRTSAGETGRPVDLGPCEQLRAPEGSVLTTHLYARGVQIYRWDGAGWQFDGPSAGLYANAQFTGQVGTHSAGPKWVHFGGGTVRGSSPQACPVDPDAIPWLLLRATPDPVAGIFTGVTSIQRVNTVGGKMPVGSGAAPGEVRQVPYTAEYYFYR